MKYKIFFTPIGTYIFLEIVLIFTFAINLLLMVSMNHVDVLVFFLKICIILKNHIPFINSTV